MTKRSPRVTAGGDSSRSRAAVVWPGCGVSSGKSRRQADSRQHLRGALMDAHARAVPQRPRRRQQLQIGVDAARGLERPGATSVSPRATLVDVDAAEIDRRALAGARLGLLLAVHLHAAHLHAAAARRIRSSSSIGNPPRHQRAGDDRAEALHR